DSDAGNRPLITFGAEAAHRLIALLLDPLRDRKEAVEGVHLHLRTGDAAAGDRAAIARSNARGDGAGASAGRGARTRRDGEDDLDGGRLAFDLREALFNPANDRSDHARLGAENEFELLGTALGDGLIDLLEDESEDIRGGADDAAATRFGFERERKHSARNLEVGSDVRVRVLGPHPADDIIAKKMVDDAAPFAEIMEALEEARDALSVVRRVHGLDRRIIKLTERAEERLEVLSHISVRAKEDIQ